MKYSLAIAIISFNVVVAAAPKHDHAAHLALQNELVSIKAIYESETGRLRRVTDARWAKRQKQVEQKTALQQSSDKTNAEIERIYGEIARIREEMLIRENSLTETRNAFDREKELFKGTGMALETILHKEEDAIRSGFIIGQQVRSLQIQEILLDLKNNPGQYSKILGRLQKYLLDNLAQQTSSSISKETILLADNSITETPVIRLGNVAAFGINDTGTAYYLGYTGQSTSPFQWVVLTDEQASRHQISVVPQWLKTGTVDGLVYVDVLQNSYSGELLGYERTTATAAIVSFVKAGGIVMLPLGLICLWAIILLVNRLFVYTTVHSHGNRFIDEAVEFLSQKKHDEARAFAGKSKGVLARILSTCLHHSKWKRPVAEKAVKELLLAEIPALDKHLDTLAVLAGAAPLLGLLGTVTGMISMFESITRFGTGDPKLLAGGISEALVTTEVGLAIAIPVLLIHNFLRNRRNHIQADMEMYAMRILNRLWPEE